MRAAVVMTTRDRAPLLGRVLGSLRRQELPAGVEAEAVLVDDGSRDATPEILESFAADPGPFRVRLVRREGEGKSGSLNSVLPGIEADFVAFTDDDMELAPRWLAAFAAHFQACPCVGAQGRIEVRFLEGRPAWITRRIEWLLGASHDTLARGGEVRHLAGGNMAVRREAMRAAGPFRRDLGPRGRRRGYSEDVEWSRRLAARGKLCFCPAALNFHLIPPRRASRWAVWCRQLQVARTEWRLRVEAGEFPRPRRELVRELRGLAGALLAPRRPLPGFDHALEVAWRLGRVLALSIDNFASPR